MLTQASDYKYQDVTGLNVAATPIYANPSATLGLRFTDVAYLAETGTCAMRLMIRNLDLTIPLETPQKLSRSAYLLCKSIQDNYNTYCANSGNLYFLDPTKNLPSVAVTSSYSDNYQDLPAVKSALRLPALNWEEEIGDDDGKIRKSDFLKAFEMTNKMRRIFTNRSTTNELTLAIAVHQTITRWEDGVIPYAPSTYDTTSKSFGYAIQGEYYFNEYKDGDDNTHTRENETKHEITVTVKNHDMFSTVTLKNAVFRIFSRSPAKELYVVVPVNRTSQVGQDLTWNYTIDKELIKPYQQTLGLNAKDYTIAYQGHNLDLVFNRRSDIS